MGNCAWNEDMGVGGFQILELFIPKEYKYSGKQSENLLFLFQNKFPNEMDCSLTREGSGVSPLYLLSYVHEWMSNMEVKC